MTSEDQDAVVGRTIRQLRDVKEKLAKLKAHVHSIGDSFSTVAHHLRNQPELLRFQNEITDDRFIESREEWRANRGAPEPHIPLKDDIDLANILACRDERRECVLEQDRLQQSLKQMGYGGSL
jgi:hypothetical protein